MELLETQNPEKRKLIETSERHKRELEKEVNQITEKTERAITNALIIGGSLLLTYILVSTFSGPRKRKRKKHKVRPAREYEEEGDEVEEEPAEAGFLSSALVSQIGAKLVNQATLVLLDIGREKLKDYLHHKEKDENS